MYVIHLIILCDDLLLVCPFNFLTNCNQTVLYNLHYHVIHSKTNDFVPKFHVSNIKEMSKMKFANCLVENNIAYC